MVWFWGGSNEVFSVIVAKSISLFCNGFLAFGVMLWKSSVFHVYKDIHPQFSGTFRVFFFFFFLALLGLRFCARAFSSCGKRGPLFAVRGPLTIAASLVAEHRLQMWRLSNCGSRVQLLHGMWDLPRPGLEPMSPALAGRSSTTAPPGKPHSGHLINQFYLSCYIL